MPTREIGGLLRMTMNNLAVRVRTSVNALKSRHIKKNVLGKIFGNFRSSWDIKDVETMAMGTDASVRQQG
jgi:hypothetical protein